MIQETHCLIFISASAVASAVMAFAAGLLVAGVRFNTFKQSLVDSYGASKKDDDELYDDDVRYGSSSEEEGLTDDDTSQKYKLMLCVRNDLKMGKGKMCAQCGHATLGIFRKFIRNKNMQDWIRSGQAKIAVKVSSEEELLKLHETARTNGIPSFIVHDAGHTQIAPGTATVVAIGPASSSRLQSLTGHLSLL